MTAFDIDDALAAALDDPGPVPSSGPELVRYAGGRAALTRELSGMNRAPRKGDYPDEAGYRAARTRWRTAQRRAQRFDEEGKPGKQARGRSRVTLTDEQRTRVRDEATDRKWSTMIRRGVRMRLYALLRVRSPGPGKRPEPPRARVLPSQGTPGVFITAEQIAPVLGLVSDGDNERAAFELLVAFGEGYGWDMEGVEFDSIERVKIWPEGSREPA